MNKTVSTKVPQNSASHGRQTSGETEARIDLGDLFRTIWRGKWIVGLFVLLAVGFGIYYAYFMATPLYRSTAVVMLNNREEQVVDLESVVGGLGSDTSVVNTEVQVLQSRSLLNKVVADQDLTEDPEFNPALRPPSAKTRLKAQIKSLLGLPESNQEDFTAEDQAARERAATVDALGRALSVRNVAQSLVFNVTVETTSAKKSAQIADALVRLYILDQIEVKFEATEQATSWLTDRVSELREELETAEARLNAFRAETELIDAETLAAMERQLQELRDRRGEVTASLETNQAQLEALQGLQDDPAAFAEESGDSQLQQFLPRIDEDGIGQAFDNRVEQIVSRIELNIQRNRNQIQALDTSISELEQQIERQSKDLIDLQQLTRETEASRLLYEYFLARLKETSAQQGIHQADSRILSSAVVPINPSAPRKSMILLMCGILGLMVGTVVVLLREARNKAIRTPDQLETATGYTVWGTIPQLPQRTRKSVLKYLSEKPTSAAAEAIRNLRTSVLLSNVDEPPRVIMVSSSLAAEGKTTMSIALAQNLARMGRSVLLIEGDIRRRVFQEYFNEKDAKGLSDVLTQGVDLADAVFRDENIGADVLLGDKSAYNAADLFSSNRFGSFIEHAREQYDTVVIDTPPVLLVPDARIIAQVADAVMLVVRWNFTQEAEVTNALRMFESVDRPVDGLVLNQVNVNSMKRYGGGYGYGYGYDKAGSRYYIN